MRIHHEVIGDGEPVVLVHGWGTDARRNWVDTGWVDALIPFRKVVLWPGARLRVHPPERVPVHVPDQLIAQEMLDALRRAILDVALRRFAASAVQ